MRPCLLCPLFVLSTLMSTIQSTKPSTIYEALRSHGLPAGLLPKGVTDFSVDDSGRFEVHLDRDCNPKFESELHYEMNVSGVLSDGQIGDLSGISAQELFLWFQVKSIRVDIPSTGLIYFDVGVVYKQFSLSLFEIPPECMAGSGDSGGISEGITIIQRGYQSESRNVLYQHDWEDFGRDVIVM